MQNIDHIDRALLRVLQRDSSLSQRALAEAVGLSQNACWKRLAQLRKCGLLGQYTLRLDPRSLGLGFTAFVMVRTRHHDHHWLARFRSIVLAIPNVVEFHRIAGDYDYLLKIVAHDMHGFDKVYRQMIEQIDLDTVTSHIVMEAIADNRELPI
ncbi:Lrp/AsnC family transcriptional regulator [Acidomonas methanolica]|uniref:Transcriptional regulator Lrp/AsnC n=1 Tax=Acidomonas methanolica NBRC 104435 TaxID=1231351 RepID=A0A023D758_ACIMT|nr:Lrp/AsnC family transcriptional regulator [Acidomonas methanolica]MBU2655490.1 Lrp/AsnC family transcriptional regulator [Acidomonas methanolica]TCS21747.1 Lrp/AsnC family transcriptional regulator [Acidomonas methanolica]GAJ29636.1 transcriptional regulator Lrp/AsnC [Acidomonas methanolica NBRC 104435]GBQ58936.1 AsnC family transcriptional regulator [Acidomonas methanolica]GEL00314.1 transcriptional regulator [Acidomonas methanolica NBRC 104435]